MWELDHKEGWVLKNWCFWKCWRRLLTVPWTARRSNQLILEEISPEYSLEGLMLKLKLQSFGRSDSLEKTLMLGKIEVRGRRRRQRIRWLDGIIGWMASPVGWHHHLDGHESEQALGVGDRQGSLVCWSPWGHKESDTTKRLNWTECGLCAYSTQYSRCSSKFKELSF